MARTRSLATRAKISAALKGRRHSAAHCAAICRAWQSPEYRTKQAVAIIARRGKPLSAEHRMKLSAVGKRRRHSEATRAKMSATRRGVPKSDEHRAAISAARRRQPRHDAPSWFTPAERRVRVAFLHELDARLAPDPRDAALTRLGDERERYSFRDLRRMQLALERLAQTTGRTMDELVTALDHEDDEESADAVPR